MSLHDSKSSRDADRRGRFRDARASRHAGSAVDGILVLMPSDSPRDRHASSSDSMAGDAALVQLRAERDAALEDIAFLEEQLRSTLAYHTHLLAQERARTRAEHQALLREVALLGEELARRANEETSPAVARPAGDDAAVVAGPASER